MKLVNLLKKMSIRIARTTDLDHFLERCRRPPLDKTELCPRCSELRFEDKTKEGGHYSHYIVNMAVIDFSCTLCWFLRLSPGYDHYFLCDVLGGLRSEVTFSPSVCLSSPGSRWLSLSVYDTIPKVLFKHDPYWPKDSEMVNLDVLRNNFELCKTEHRAVCGARKLLPVSGLQLINCETLKREAATADMEYVALSYVWGPAQQRIYLDGETLSKKLLPRTIRDAVNITMQLGFKHLWVDQICIHQNGAHKMDQIRKMHHIYRNSEITIIAAAGDHSDYGIPGSPEMPRLPQICCKIGDRLYTEMRHNPVSYVANTPWNHRGWTFQEEVMSRRTIFFTDREAWFSCACMTPSHGSEFADAECCPRLQSGSAFRKDEAAKNPFLPPCVRMTTTRVPDFNSSWVFKELVETYSKRDLTVSDDVINAFSGILGMSEQLNPPVYHIWGSPILPPHHSLLVNNFDPKTDDTVSKPQNPSLEGFLRGLCFQRSDDGTRNAPLVRRPGFPSWSWTGWIGGIHFNYPDDCEDGYFPDTGLSIAVERADGNILSWAEFEKLAYLKKDPENISQFIHVQAWTVTVKLENLIFQLPNANNSRLYHVTQTSDGEEYHKVDFINQKSDDLTTEELHLVTTKTYTAILVSSIERFFSRGEGYFMLVETKTDHAERVGILKPALFHPSQNSVDELSKIQSKRDVEIGGMKLQWKETRLG